MVVFLLWAASPVRLNPQEVVGEILKLNQVDYRSETNTLKVLTWNMGFLHGDGSEGSNYVPQGPDYYKKKMDATESLIKRLGSDVVFLQEIDFKAKRTHFTDQLKSIGTNSGYSYIAYAPSWVHNYIPFPYFPLSSQFGAMNSGGGILSKYPIIMNKIFLLEKPAGQPFWYNLFYLYRYVQVVTIQTPTGNQNIMNVHLEAFDKENRKIHLTYLEKLITEYKPIILAGDFNSLPVKAQHRGSFKNSNDNYENDYNISIINNKMNDCIDDQTYLNRENDFFTFPSTKPDRKLDFIFHDKQLKTVKCVVEKGDDLNISDHLPMYAEFVAFEPVFIRD